MKRASYRNAVDFIALNDSPGDNDPADILKGYASVVLVSEIFGVPTDRVACDVLRVRAKEKLAELREERAQNGEGR